MNTAKIQVLVVSDSRYMLAGMVGAIKHEKGEIHECFYEDFNSIQAFRPLYQDGFDLVLIGFHDVVKASAAAVALNKRMPRTPLFSLVELGACAESEAILRNVSKQVIHRDTPPQDLAQIIADTHDALFLSIRRIKPKNTLVLPTHREALILYHLQDRVRNSVDLGTATGMSRGTIDRTMRGFSEKIGTPNDRLALAVASLRMLGDLRLDALGKVVLP